MSLIPVLRLVLHASKAACRGNPGWAWRNMCSVHHRICVGEISNHDHRPLCCNLLDGKRNRICQTITNLEGKATGILPPYQVRWYAKKTKKEKKEKGGKKSGKVRVELSAEELQEVIDFHSLTEKMEHCLATLQEEYATELSIRTNAGVFEQLTVVTPDGKYPLVQLGQVAQKGPDTVIINMTAMPQYVTAVKDALLNSGMNLNPQQDGLFLFVPLPKVTREHREALARNAKVLCDRTKDKLRDIQNNYIRAVKKKKEAHSDDLIHNLQETIHATTHDFSNQAEKLMAMKQQELQVTK